MYNINWKYLSFLVMLIILIGCSSAEVEKSNNDVKTLTIAPNAWMVEKLNIEEAVEKFENDNPDIKVEIKPYSDKDALANFALSWSQDKTDVDLVATSTFQNASSFVDQDLLVDFNETELFESSLQKESFVGETLEFGNYKDVQFGIPFALEVYAININKNLLKNTDLLDEENRVINPDSWDKIYENAKKLKKSNEEGMIMQWGVNAQATMLATMIAATGGYEKDGVLSYNNDEMKEILKNWKKGVDEGVYSITTFTDHQSGWNNYKAEQVGMMLDSGSHAVEASEVLEEGVAGVIPIPGSLENGSYAFTPGWIMPSASENQELAISFIQEALMDPKNQAEAALSWGKLPILQAAYEEIESDWSEVLLEIAENSKSAPFYSDYALIDKNIPTLLQEYLNGEISLDDFVNRVDEMVAGISH